MTDPHNLARFVEAQNDVYDIALAEIRGGEKRSHWMWFIFPQTAGLGFSEMSQRHAIDDREEAKAYLAHPALGPRLMECALAALEVPDRSARDIFDSVDAMKLQSSATLFAAVSDAGSAFHQLLEKYFDGQRDGETIELLDR